MKCNCRISRFFYVYRNVVKSFYTASLLYDVLTQFGEMSEEVGEIKQHSFYYIKFPHVPSGLEEKQPTCSAGADPGGIRGDSIELCLRMVEIVFLRT